MLTLPKDQYLITKLLTLNYIVVFIQLAWLFIYHTIFESAYIFIPVGIFGLIPLMTVILYVLRSIAVRNMHHHPTMKYAHILDAKTSYASLHLAMVTELNLLIVLFLLSNYVEWIKQPWMVIIVLAQFVVVMMTVMIVHQSKSKRQVMVR